MATLNSHDIIFEKWQKYKNLKGLIESCYGFSILKVEPVPYISFTSKKALLYTNKGIFFLKEKPFYCSDEVSLKMSSLFQNFLGKQLSFIPRYLKTIDNRDYIEFEGRFYFLTEYKIGRCFNGSVKDVKQILSSLLKFQRVASKFPCNFDQKTESYEVLHISRLLNNFIHNPKEQEINKQICKLINKLKHQYNKVTKKPFIMSHGDFSLFNIIFNKNSSVIAINDFDNVNFLPRIHDLAEFFVSATLLNYIGPTTNWKKPVFISPNKSMSKLILSFYSDNFDLTVDEIILFPVVVKIIWMEILILAVVKEDYSLSDIRSNLKIIESNRIDSIIWRYLRKKLFIWDFHNTLETGTLNIITQIANSLLRENGGNKVYTTKEIENFPSFSWETFFKNELPHFTKDEIKKLVCEAYNEKRFGYLNKKYSRPQKHSKEILKFIKAKGDINVVVSNSRNDKLSSYIKNIGLQKYIDFHFGIDDGRILSKDDVIRKKIKTIKIFLKRYKKIFSEIIVISDSFSELEIVEKIKADIFCLFKSLKIKDRIYQNPKYKNYKAKLMLVKDLIQIEAVYKNK